MSEFSILTLHPNIRIPSQPDPFGRVSLLIQNFGGLSYSAARGSKF